MCAMKTPGVYVVEKSAFPNSVVEVATAVPAFIGHTEFARNGSKSLSGVPWRISSMAEYEQYFGGAPVPVYQLNMSGNAILFSVNSTNVAVALAVVNETMTKALNLLKKSSDATQSAGGQTDDSVKAVFQQQASDALLQAQEATGFLLSAALDLAKVLGAVGWDENKCKAIMDAAGAGADLDGKSADELTSLITNLQKALAPLTNTEVSNLKPKEYNLSVTRKDLYNLYYQLRFFFANGGGACYIVSVGDYHQALSKSLFISGIDTLLQEQEPTMVLVPEAVKLKEEECYDIQTALLQHCGNDMRNRVALLDIYDGYKDRKDESGDFVTKFRDAIGTGFLDYGTVYYPWLNTSVVSDSELNFLNLQQSKDDLIALLKAGAPYLKIYLDEVEQVFQTVEDESNDAALLDPNHIQTLHKILANQSPLYAAIMKEMVQDLNLLPPAAGMAGVYTLVDSTQEVWKAPANIGIANVVSPAVNISSASQEDLNVPLNGKSVNAIRYFVGDGVKVWGARTLDGNSLDWRYINVRRTMIMLEESIKNAAKAFVFEANTANTWVSVKSMVSNFLNGIWKRGGLAGAAPEDAYSVHIGLGDTMTPEDILEGILRITVLVAVVRPAEFIEITFQQQMQKS